MMMTWEQVIENTKNTPKSNVRYFRIKPGEKQTIRLLGGIIQYYEYAVQHNGKWKYAICDVDEDNDIKMKYSVSPKKKFAINILNKTTNRMEIYRGSDFTFNEFGNFQQKTGKNPSSADGALFEISVPKEGKTFHKVKFIGPDVLSEQDISFIRTNELYDLKKVFKPVPANKLEEVLFSDDSPAPVISEVKSKTVVKNDLMDLDF